MRVNIELVWLSTKRMEKLKLVFPPVSKKEFEDTKGSNQNLYIEEEEQTTQRPKEKGQKDKQRSTKHTHKTKDRVTRTPLKTWG